MSEVFVQPNQRAQPAPNPETVSRVSQFNDHLEKIYYNFFGIIYKAS